MIPLLQQFAREYPIWSGFLAVVMVAGLTVIADEWRRNQVRQDRETEDQLAARRRAKVRDAVNRAYEHEPRWHHWR